MKKTIIIISLFLITINSFSQTEENKSEFSAGLGFTNIQFEHKFSPSLINPVLLSIKYKYNFRKRLSLNTQLKFANGFKHVSEPEDGFEIITYNSIGIFPAFDIIKKKKLESNIGIGVSKTFFWTSTPAENITDIEHLNVKYDGGAFYTAPFLTGNVKYLFNNNTFIGLSFDYEYYPYRYYIQTFSSKISFGVKF